MKWDFLAPVRQKLAGEHDESWCKQKISFEVVLRWSASAASRVTYARACHPATRRHASLAGSCPRPSRRRSLINKHISKKDAWFCFKYDFGLANIRLKSPRFQIFIPRALIVFASSNWHITIFLSSIYGCDGNIGILPAYNASWNLIEFGPDPEGKRPKIYSRKVRNDFVLLKTRKSSVHAYCFRNTNLLLL